MCLSIRTCFSVAWPHSEACYYLNNFLKKVFKITFVPADRSRDSVPLFRVRCCDKIIARCVSIQVFLKSVIEQIWHEAQKTLSTGI